MRPGPIDVLVTPPLKVESGGWPEMVRLRDLARTIVVRLVGEPPVERLPER